jgi:Raf kinase inhibitor-like YbhB/YbcL family protein
MEIKSRAFNNEENIPTRYTCDGEDINPPLDISDIPEEAETVALIMDDPDAPNGTWVHWVLWNIPIINSGLSIDEGVEPADAVYGTNDFDKLEYGGPCPPFGTHRYFFKVYALDRELDLESGASKEELMMEIEKYMVDWAELVGKYSKK